MDQACRTAGYTKIRQEDGSFWATVEEYPGGPATGDDLEELPASFERSQASASAELLPA